MDSNIEWDSLWECNVSKNIKNIVYESEVDICTCFLNNENRATCFSSLYIMVSNNM